MYKQDEVLKKLDSLEKLVEHEKPKLPNRFYRVVPVSNDTEIDDFLFGTS
jgi:hypothetical protein